MRRRLDDSPVHGRVYVGTYLSYLDELLYECDDWRNDLPPRRSSATRTFPCPRCGLMNRVIGGERPGSTAMQIPQTRYRRVESKMRRERCHIPLAPSQFLPILRYQTLDSRSPLNRVETKCTKLSASRCAKVATRALALAPECSTLTNS